MTDLQPPPAPAPTTSILFVDDQTNLLQGLQRSLRGMRNEWTMRFASSGKEALAMLDMAPADVVVTDMRMPEMNGAELLSEIRARFPDTVRIILSGEFDQQTGLKALESTHQFLSKPCDSHQLIDAIRRSAQRRELLSNATVRQIVLSLDALPSLPEVYTRLLDLLQGTDAPSKEIAALIESDIGLFSKTLQVANSSFFAMSRQVTSGLQAVNMLGLDVIRGLVLSHGIQQNFQARLDARIIEGLWQSAMTIATLASALARRLDLPLAVQTETFTASLLRDVGQLVFLSIERRYIDILDAHRNDFETLLGRETSTFGTTHADVGAYLLGLWNLPDVIVETAAFHHQPSRSPVRQKGALAMVHVAGALSAVAAGQKNPLDQAYLREAGLPADLGFWQAALLASGV
ncbi:response regulator [Oleomonas cavernae]|nr:response regulator [Oleomonas cavernae]